MTSVSILLIVVIGCGPEPSSPPVLEIDSAGVTIVESVAPRWTSSEGWTLDSVPFFTLSGPGPEYDFARVVDATVLRDRRVVVLDEGSYDVRFFDPGGAFLGAVGQEGEGPGDFSRLTSVSELPGDSVLVFDYWLRRATILDRTGSVGRIVTLAPDVQVAELYPTATGSFVAMTWSLDDFVEIDGAYRADYVIARVAADGADLETIARLPGWSGYKVNSEDGGYRDYAPLFPVDGHLAVGDAGLLLGPAERMEFLEYSVQGELERVVRVPALDEPLEEAEVRAARESMIRPGSSSEYRDVVRRLPAPELRPPYSDLLIDSEGFVWVARYRSPRTQRDDPIRWYVFTPEGAWLGSITTPSRFTVYEVGPDHVLGARRDELDVQRIEMLRLSR